MAILPSVLGGRSTVGRQTLDLSIGVRIPASQPDFQGTCREQVPCFFRLHSFRAFFKHRTETGNEPRTTRTKKTDNGDDVKACSRRTETHLLRASAPLREEFRMSLQRRWCSRRREAASRSRRPGGGAGRRSACPPAPLRGAVRNNGGFTGGTPGRNSPVNLQFRVIRGRKPVLCGGVNPDLMTSRHGIPIASRVSLGYDSLPCREARCGERGRVEIKPNTFPTQGGNIWE